MTLKKESFLSMGSFGNSLFTALFLSVLEIIFVVSFAALIYSGDLSGFVSHAIGFILFGDAILCLVVALLSSNSGSIAIEQDATGAMLGVASIGIMAALAGSLNAQFATVTMMVILTSLLTGVTLLALGYFKLGGLVRFLPYPVIGGFLAGTGWFLIVGGIGLMADETSIGMTWLQPAVLVLWLPGLALALIIHWVTQKSDKPYIIPGLILLATLLFYGIVLSMGLSLPQLRETGWLLDPMQSATAWQLPLNSGLLTQVDWGTLLKFTPAIIPIITIAIVNLLLNSSAMELVAKKDIDLNRELIAAGVGNISAGLAGGLVGFQDVSFSTLNHSLTGSKTRLVGILIAVILFLTIFVGTSAVLLIPKFVFGAALVLLGIQLISEWVYEAWFKFSRSDFFVIILILLVVVFRGFLEGIVAGLVLALIMFAVSYSQIRVIRFMLSGSEYRSRVTRKPEHQKWLETHGEKIRILKLEGFIFFGTANGILAELRSNIAMTQSPSIEYVLLDFSKVRGIDSTGMLSFARMFQWGQESGITLVLTGLTENLLKRFQHEISKDQEAHIHLFPDLDHGIEWCENTILSTRPSEQTDAPDLFSQLYAVIKVDGIQKLIPHLLRREFSPGEYLMKEGDPADLMYFIESGQVTAQLGAPGENPVRLETMQGGRTVGELGFYRGSPRTASVIVDQPSVIYVLSKDALKKLEAEEPETASIFHHAMVLLLSERVAHLSRTVGTLERS